MGGKGERRDRLRKGPGRVGYPLRTQLPRPDPPAGSEASDGGSIPRPDQPPPPQQAGQPASLDSARATRTPAPGSSEWSGPPSAQTPSAQRRPARIRTRCGGGGRPPSRRGAAADKRAPRPSSEGGWSGGGSARPEDGPPPSMPAEGAPAARERRTPPEHAGGAGPARIRTRRGGGD